ncbi:carnosine N-methyltransferase 2 isoform X2 [Anolis carolinensis]|uniref:carnosine N-methyltransferase 2 isoform X2 n=1 Tax=Anolis carolinensis TaxID=28377 RepID=UPI002F2B3794
MEPKAKVKRVFKPKQSKIADGCRRVGVFSKGICPVNGSRLPLVRAINEDDEHDSRKVKDATFDREILLTPSNNTELSAFQAMRSLTIEEYAKVFKSFLEHSTEHQCMEQFNKEELPSIIASLGNGKSTINVLGVGSGTDAVMGSDLKNVSFTWHQLTSMEYEKQTKEKSMQKKYDFIHLIQMLYRVENIASTIKYFHSCLDDHGKLLIIILSGNSGWTTMWKKYRQCFPPTDCGHYITGDDVKVILEEMGLKYQMYEFPSDWDITECFTDGDIIGGHTLDFLTGTKDFMNTAPDDLKQSLRQALCQPECSTKKDGRIMFRNDLSMIVVNS